MKQLLIVVFFTFQMIISTATLAWSPLDSLEYAIESMQQCYTVVAVSEEGQLYEPADTTNGENKPEKKNSEIGKEEDQDGQKKGEEEEEEPDCD